MREDTDQGFMLLVVGVLAAVLVSVIWYTASDNSSSQATDVGVEHSAADSTATPETEPAPATATASSAGATGTRTTPEASETPDASETADASETPDTSETPDPVTEPTPADDLPDGGNPVSISVTADDSTITLEGVVDSEALRLGIGREAEALYGVDNVVNLLEVDTALSLIDGGLITSLTGAISDPLRAQAVRSLAGVGSVYEIQSTDNLTVVEPAEIASQLNRLVSFNPIEFATGSVEIEAASHSALDSAVELLGRNPGIGILVGGHTDDQGVAETNLALSDARAAAVVEYMVSQGVNPDQLAARGFGSTRPVADNATEEGRAENRRIEFSPLEG